MPGARTRVRSPFGVGLREHRTARRLSQLDLADEAGVSQRHISFLETGRSSPSREMVIHLGVVMGLGLREQNDLLLAAGFAPAYPETGLDEPAMDDVRHVLELLLAAHDPFPAFVVDRGWDAVMMNEAGTRLAGLVAAGRSDGEPFNLLRVALHPDGMRAFTVNWTEVARSLIQRLYRDVASRPADHRLRALLDEVLDYEGVPRPNEALLPTGTDLIVPIHYRVAGNDVRLVTTITTLGAPYDVTLEELRLEVTYPADAATEGFLRSLAT